MNGELTRGPDGSARARGRASWAWLFGDMGLGWWVLNVVGTVLLAGTCWSVYQQSSAWWVHLVLALAFGCWLVHMLEGWFPRVGYYALAPCALLSATLVGPTGGAVLVVTLVAVMVFCSRSEASAPMIGALAATTAVVSLCSLLAAGSDWSGALLALAGLLVVVLVALNRREHDVRAAQTERLLEQTRYAQAEQARAAALDERARIARELHDVLAHSLGGLRIQLEVAEALLAEQRDVDGALTHVRRSRRLALDGMAEARNAVTALRSDPRPLPEVLEELVTSFCDDHAGAGELTVTGTPRALSSGAEICLQRIGREALTNVTRHAPGASVTMELTYGAGVVLVVDDAGTQAEPLPSADGAGFGLDGMRERLALIGGTLYAGPRQFRKGWRVRVEVPE